VNEGSDDPDVNRLVLSSHEISLNSLPGPNDQVFQEAFEQSYWDDFRDLYNPPRWDPVLSEHRSNLTMEQHFDATPFPDACLSIPLPFHPIDEPSPSQASSSSVLTGDSGE
jgi:hypothetical protein